MADTSTRRADVAPPKPSPTPPPAPVLVNDQPTIIPLEAGRSITIEGVGSIEIRSTTQRNWSRVAIGRRGDDTVFVKQFVDRVGRSHPRGFEGDQRTAERLGDEVVDGVRVVPNVGRDPHQLIAVYPYIEMATIDSIVKVGPEHARTAGRVGEALAAILGSRLVDDPPGHTDIWKGLDPKNIGWTPEGQLWIFDFGPPTLVERRVAAARVLATGLLSRWVARPGMHLLRPERVAIEGVCRPLTPYTTFESVDRALRSQRELRMREPQRTRLAATATRLGLQTLGRVHWAAVRYEARRLFDET